MKQIITAAAILALGVLAAQAQSIGEKTGTNSVLGIAPKTSDFIKEVAMSDMFEIRASELAVQKATTPDAKQFASQMVSDHTQTSSELKGMVKDKSELPTGLDSSLQGKLDKLKGLQGDDFTKQYISYQVSAHKDAVSLFDRYAKGGDNPQIKNWASRTLPKLQHHLDMAQALKD